MAKRKPKKKPAATAGDGYPANPNAGTAIVATGTPRVGRGFWLNLERIQQFEALLSEDGSTDDNACNLMGISPGRFYQYLQTGRAMKGLERMPESAPHEPESRRLCEQFLEAVTRGRAKAIQKATRTVMKAIAGQTTGEVTTRTYSETRINPKTGEPYIYTETTVTERLINIAPDWRASIEYLARRDKSNWSERLEIQAVPFEQLVIERIKAGAVDYDSLLEEFKDSVLVNGWFQLAGVDPAYKKG